MMILSVILAAVALIAAIFAFAFAARAIIEVEGFKKSTHQLTYVDPTKQNFSDFGDDIKKTLADSDETLEVFEKLKSIRKK